MHHKIKKTTVSNFTVTQKKKQSGLNLNIITLLSMVVSNIIALMMLMMMGKHPQKSIKIKMYQKY